MTAGKMVHVNSSAFPYHFLIITFCAVLLLDGALKH